MGRAHWWLFEVLVWSDVFLLWYSSETDFADHRLFAAIFMVGAGALFSYIVGTLTAPAS